MSLKVGDKIGDYQVVGVLGAGGMGRVYKVRNVISERIEAMKVLLPDLAHDPSLADRFTREIKVLASLGHPNIAALHTASRLENRLVMIMEFLDGVTLGDLVKRGRIPLVECIDYIDQVLSALSCAHEHGVVHRDIKPSNMMLTPEGVIKLMDFGIARTAQDHKLTVTGTTLGSLYYMSPEQVKSTEIDGRSDLYSVGITLYELATGARPFEEESSYDLMAAQLQKAPRPPVQVDPNIPQALNEVILQALEKDPGRRFQTAEAFRTALESVKSGLRGAVAASPRLEHERTRDMTSPLPVPQAPKGPPPLSSVPTPPPQPPRGGSHRALYMALGAILAIAVIVVAATQLPRWLRTSAAGPAETSSESLLPEGSSESSTVQLQQAEPEVLSSQEGTETSVISSSPVQTAPAAEPSAAVPAANQIASPPSDESSPRAHSGNPSAQGQPAGVISRAVSGGSKPAPSTRPAQAFQAVEPSTAVQTASLPVQPSAEQSNASAAAIDALQDRMTNLVARASVAEDSVESIRQQQQAMGLNLRSDIAAALSRMDQYMTRANAALQAGDANLAKRSMDSAEREINRLDRFLGR